MFSVVITLQSDMAGRVMAWALGGRLGSFWRGEPVCGYPTVVYYGSPPLPEDLKVPEIPDDAVELACVKSSIEGNGATPGFWQGNGVMLSVSGRRTSALGIADAAEELVITGTHLGRVLETYWRWRDRSIDLGGVRSPGTPFAPTFF